MASRNISSPFDKGGLIVSCESKHIMIKIPRTPSYTIFERPRVNEVDVVSEEEISFARVLHSHVCPCNTFPSKLGQSIDASFVRILECRGEQREFSIILSPSDG